MMIKKIPRVILVTLISMFVIVNQALAVSEGAMSRPSSFGINQGYLYGEILDGVAHKGIDFSNTLDSPVYAAYAGTVYSIGWSV